MPRTILSSLRDQPNGRELGPPSLSVPPRVVERMRALLPCQSKETVMQVLGISSNTWLKLKRGVPIRSSVAERIIARFGAETTAH